VLYKGAEKRKLAPPVRCEICAPKTPETDLFGLKFPNATKERFECFELMLMKGGWFTNDVPFHFGVIASASSHAGSNGK